MEVSPFLEALGSGGFNLYSELAPAEVPYILPFSDSRVPVQSARRSMLGSSAVKHRFQFENAAAF